MKGDYIRRKVPFLYQLFLLFMEKQADNKLIGEHVSFGELHPDKTFFLIRINNHGLGLLGVYNCVLGYLRIAEKFNYIPIVDLKNYANGYLYKDEIGKKNSWEYYFEQPSKYCLDEVYQSKHVVLASGVNPREASPIILRHYYLLYPKNRSELYYRIIRDQLKLKMDIKHQIDNEFNQIIKGKRVLGIVKRGSDMINCKGHAIQPDIKDLIAKASYSMTKWNCDFLFLASEETIAVDEFKKIFGDKLLTNQSARINEYIEKKAYTDISFNRENDKYLKGLEYLTTVVLLSRCTCLIGSLVGATAGALGMNGGRYENTYIYDLGEYK